MAPQASWPPDVPAESLEARIPQPGVLSQASSARNPQPGILSKIPQPGFLSQESPANLFGVCVGVISFCKLQAITLCRGFAVEYSPKAAKVVSEYMFTNIRRINYRIHQNKIECLTKFLGDARKLPRSILSIVGA